MHKCSKMITTHETYLKLSLTFSQISINYSLLMLHILSNPCICNNFVKFFLTQLHEYLTFCTVGLLFQNEHTVLPIVKVQLILIDLSLVHKLLYDKVYSYACIAITKLRVQKYSILNSMDNN